MAKEILDNPMTNTEEDIEIIVEDLKNAKIINDFYITEGEKIENEIIKRLQKMKENRTRSKG